MKDLRSQCYGFKQRGMLLSCFPSIPHSCIDLNTKWSNEGSVKDLKEVSVSLYNVRDQNSVACYCHAFLQSDGYTFHYYVKKNLWTISSFSSIRVAIPLELLDAKSCAWQGALICFFFWNKTDSSLMPVSFSVQLRFFDLVRFTFTHTICHKCVCQVQVFNVQLEKEKLVLLI